MNTTPNAAGHDFPHPPYIKVWAALALFTGIEYAYAYLARDFFGMLVIGLLFWAAFKAGLVGWFFMHLKFEGSWVYLLIIPACLLATILVIALYPDQAYKPEEFEPDRGEQSWQAPGSSALPLAAAPHGRAQG